MAGGQEGARTGVIDRIVLVVGPMRSGGALVAQIVHRLGYMVAVQMPAPIPPAWRSDFEDLELTLRLMRREPVDWKIYLENRRSVSRLCGFDGRIAVKSAYLALHWPALLEAAGDPVVFRTYRSSADMDRSVAAHPQLNLKDREEIRRALQKVRPTAELGYEHLVENPLVAVHSIAHHLGVCDESSIVSAAALVGRPTNYTSSTVALG